MQVTKIPSLPRRPVAGHKGTFGRVLIFGGSTGMSGAIALCGMGALRSGTGLVSLALPASVMSIVATLEPSYLTIPLDEDEEGKISGAAIPRFSILVEGKDAVAMGPGMGRSQALDRLVEQLYRQVEKPLVIDADALNSLAERPELLPHHAGPRILTPHPGEFSRLLGCNVSTVQGNRESLAMQFADENQVLLILKGHKTLVTDGQKIYVNQTGNPGMGTGGTGDALTGIVAALLAQKLDPFEAAQLAVFVHGLAGDLAAEELSQYGMTASDLIEFLPYAWKIMEEQEGDDAGDVS